MGEVETDAKRGLAGLVAVSYCAMGGLFAPDDQRLTGDHGDPGIAGRCRAVAKLGQGAPLATRA
jgi:hypothetical protein